MGSIFLPVGSTLSILGASLWPCTAAATSRLLLLGELVSVGLLPGLHYIWHHGIDQRQRLDGPPIK